MKELSYLKDMLMVLHKDTIVDSYCLSPAQLGVSPLIEHFRPSCLDTLKFIFDGFW